MRNEKFYRPYQKHHGHKIKNCETLKKFLEELVTKGHLAKYIKQGEKAKKDNDDEEYKQIQWLSNRVMASLIEVIHRVANKDSITKNGLRVYINQAQCAAKAFPGEVLSITEPKRGKDQNGTCELSFTSKDMYSVNIPYNDAQVLMVNNTTFDIECVLVDPGSS